MGLSTAFSTLHRVGLTALGALLGVGCAAATPTQDCTRDAVCTDADCDTICDLVEGAPDLDTDGDGLPDYLDTDADDDGIDDRREAGEGDLRTAPVDRNRNGIPDYQDALYPLGVWSTPPDATTPEAGDAGPPPDQMCSATPDGCDENEKSWCDGLDNDCNGIVDGPGGNCDCQRGEVRPCFAGSAAQRGIGTCDDGHQVCEGYGQTYWGPCIGGSGPQAERCDGVDNDCNGCSDELADCNPAIDCPLPGDPRLPDTLLPGEPYELRASDFYAGGDAVSYAWHIRSSGCDGLFAAIDPEADSGSFSYELLGANEPNATLRASLSGSYRVELVVSTPDEIHRCQWPLQVGGPGLRVELCWPATGPGAGTQAIDLDLHLGRSDSTLFWGGAQDCFVDTCTGPQTPWSYPGSTADSCGSGPQQLSCPNPRLDSQAGLDGPSSSRYRVEHISLDAPRTGERFRVAVSYRDSAPSRAGITTGIEARPIVQIYCGGRLKGRFGGPPDGADEAARLDGFGLPATLWRVTDVLIDRGGTRADCTLQPLSAPGMQAGPWLERVEGGSY